MIGRYLPNLPGLYFLTDRHGDGARGWVRLAGVHRDHGLAELPNPYAEGLIDVPDSGGYALAAVTLDGGTVCERCVTNPRTPIHPPDGSGDGWELAGWISSAEVDDPDWCDECGIEWTGHEEDDK